MGFLLGSTISKDLATEYPYLGNTSEWFFLARRNAEKVIAKNDQYIKGTFFIEIFICFYNFENLIVN